MKNQKGVSLITLIITIIVVIILAVIILRSGASDAPDQAAFSGFTSEMGDLQDQVTKAMAEAKGNEAIRGNSRTNEQLYNFIARGGYDAMPANPSGDAKWLVQSDARSIPCTLINKDLADESLGVKLPVRKVETDRATNQEVSYFVTPQGNVFCWPPYVYDGKSYVNASVTAKSGDLELEGTKATEASQVTLDFGNDDVVVVDNASKKTSKGATIDVYYGRTSGEGDNNIGVWYGADDRDTPSYRGVASGYIFESMPVNTATGKPYYLNNATPSAQSGN